MIIRQKIKNIKKKMKITLKLIVNVLKNIQILSFQQNYLIFPKDQPYLKLRIQLKK